ncbi:hypothetical protein VPHD164_0026 [Vibrio phage D164]
MTKKFTMTSSIFEDSPVVEFDEESAPEWLCKGGRKGSTMDNRWFWNGHVLTLPVGGSVKTDFQLIKRIK